MVLCRCTAVSHMTVEFPQTLFKSGDVALPGFQRYNSSDLELGRLRTS